MAKLDDRNRKPQPCADPRMGAAGELQRKHLSRIRRYYLQLRQRRSITCGWHPDLSGSPPGATQSRLRRVWVRCRAGAPSTHRRFEQSLAAMGVWVGSPDFGRVCWRIVRLFHTAPKRALHDWVAPRASAKKIPLPCPEVSFTNPRQRRSRLVGVGLRNTCGLSQNGPMQPSPESLPPRSDRSASTHRWRQFRITNVECGHAR